MFEKLDAIHTFDPGARICLVNTKMFKANKKTITNVRVYIKKGKALLPISRVSITTML